MCMDVLTVHVLPAAVAKSLFGLVSWVASTVGLAATTTEITFANLQSQFSSIVVLCKLSGARGLYIMRVCGDPKSAFTEI